MNLAVEDAFLHEYGDREHTIEKWTPGNNVAAEMKAIEDAVREIAQQLKTAGKLTGRVLADQLRDYEDQMAALEVEGPKEPAWITEHTGRTLADDWRAAEDDDRHNQMFKDTGKRRPLRD